jgi:hypothetical protein
VWLPAFLGPFCGLARLTCTVGRYLGQHQMSAPMDAGWLQGILRKLTRKFE